MYDKTRFNLKDVEVTQTGFTGGASMALADSARKEIYDALRDEYAKLPPQPASGELPPPTDAAALLPGIDNALVTKAVEIWQFVQTVRSSLLLQPITLRGFLFNLFTESFDSEFIRKVSHIWAWCL